MGVGAPRDAMDGKGDGTCYTTAHSIYGTNPSEQGRSKSRHRFLDIGLDWGQASCWWQPIGRQHTWGWGWVWGLTLDSRRGRCWEGHGGGKTHSQMHHFIQDRIAAH